MKKTILKIAFTAGLGIFSLGFINTASAAVLSPEELNNFDENTIPLEVKEVLQNEGQPELNSGGGNTRATTVYPGAYTSDDKTSSIFDGNGWNVIYGEVTNAGTWSGLAYYSFQGYGYTGYLGSGTISSITSNVTAKATGVIPSISTGGSSWSLLSTAKEVAVGERIAGKKYAQGNFSNVKIQNISTLTTIFENKSYLSISGVGSETWYEDIWFWF